MPQIKGIFDIPFDSSLLGPVKASFRNPRDSVTVLMGRQETSARQTHRLHCSLCHNQICIQSP